MNILIPVLFLSVICAFLAERNAITTTKDEIKKPNVLWFSLLLITLILPVGLRTEYNDTLAYVRDFQNALPIGKLLISGELELMANPAYEVMVSLFKSLTPNYHVFFMVIAVFTQMAFVKFIWRYSELFWLSILVYICLGTYVFSMAAMKQVIAMAILTYAIPCLIEKRYVKFILITFIAALFHTYAIVFLVLLAFYGRPWRIKTLILLAATLIIMQNFESAIGSFLEYAAENGKSIAESEVFDNNQVNLYRVAVYAVVPFLSLVFGKNYFNEESVDREMFVNMSILSFMFMLMGTVNGANMFGRMAVYFELGTICCLPGIIKRVFNKDSAMIVMAVAFVGFLGYFSFAYIFGKNFSAAYRAITIWEFIRSLF